MDPEALQELATELLGDRPVGARAVAGGVAPGNHESAAGADGVTDAASPSNLKKAKKEKAPPKAQRKAEVIPPTPICPAARQPAPSRPAPPPPAHTCSYPTQCLPQLPPSRSLRSF